MRKKFLALVLVVAMVLSLVACGDKPTPTSTNTPAATPTAEPTKAPVSAVEGGEASINFEDGLFGFVSRFRPTDLSDISDLQIVEVGGSKVLYAENVSKKPETHIGFDLDALLGDKIASVKTIKFDLGSKAADDNFYAVSGKVYVYSGEGNSVKKATDFAVYMANKSPKTITINVATPFVAGQNNYIDLAKLSDAPYETASNAHTEVPIGVGFFIDNIKFLDADNKLIAVNTAAVVSETAAFNQVAAAEEFEYGSVAYLDSTQPADWTCSIPVPAEFFANATGNVSVALDIEIAEKPDYACFKLASPSWAEVPYENIVAMDTSKDAPKYFHQDDNGLVVTDFSLNKMYITLTKEGADFFAANGGMCFPGHNVTVKKATVSKDTFICYNDATQPADWTCSVPVPAEYFANATGNVSVTLDIQIAEKPDYACFKLASPSWAEVPYENIVAMDTSKDAPKYFHQDDNGLVVTDFSLNKMYITLTKEGADFFAANGGMCFPGHNVTVKGATVSHSTFTCYNDATQPADWTCSIPVPAEYFAGATGNVAVTLDIEVAEKPDYACFKLASPSWAEVPYDAIVGMDTSKDAPKYFHQDDNGLVITDFSLNKMYIVLTKEGADFFAANGGMCFPGHNVTVKGATVSKNVFSSYNDATQPADWTCSIPVPAENFAGATGNVCVILNIEIAEKPDYACFKLASPSWAEVPYENIIAMDTSKDAPKYFHQDDNGLVVTDFSLNKMYIMLTKEGADFFAANGGMCFPGHNVTVKSVVVIK